MKDYDIKYSDKNNKKNIDFDKLLVKSALIFLLADLLIMLITPILNICNSSDIVLISNILNSISMSLAIVWTATWTVYMFIRIIK